MRDTINYEGLYALEQDIENQMQSSPAFRLFNREKVRRFATQNQHRLNVMHNTIEKLRDTYVKKDEAGKPVTKEVDGRKLWDFENEEDEKKYLEEWNAFMQITFDINL